LVAVREFLLHFFVLPLFHFVAGQSPVSKTKKQQLLMHLPPEATFLVSRTEPLVTNMSVS